MEVYARVDKSENGEMLAETFNRNPLELATNSPVAGLGTATVSLSEGGHRLKIVTSCEFAPATNANVHYTVRIGHNAGGSPNIDRAAMIGVPIDARTSKGRAVSAVGHATTKPLPAGTYTFYAVPQRVSGGSAGDVAREFYILVTDLGAPGMPCA